MNNQIYLICYGDSEKNVGLSFKTNILGAVNYSKIVEGQQFYFVLKRDDDWVIVGRGIVGEAADNNPFEKPNKYKTYCIEHLERCKPFSIKRTCKKLLGDYYGLVLRTPQPIKVKKFIEYLERNFVVI